jgi:hypothetical protein
MPALRIVSNDQRASAHGRVEGTRVRLRKAFGGMGSRGPRDSESRYLLPGFARCAVCGGGLGVTGGSHSSAKPQVYGCVAYHKHGTSVCGNALKLPISRVDDAVLETLASEVRRAISTHSCMSYGSHAPNVTN